eukprot:2665797-Alexandrium_andersonii.AAC.1
MALILLILMRACWAGGSIAAQLMTMLQPARSAGSSLESSSMTLARTGEILRHLAKRAVWT